MEIELKELPGRKAVCMSHSGPYFMIGGTFGKFGQWMAETGIKTGEGVALYYDDPGVTPPAELRSDAGGFVSDDFETDDPRVHIIDVPAGTYAVATYVGHYQDLSNAWGEMASWTPPPGCSFGQSPSFEVYLNDCSTTAPEDLRTELYIPIARASTT